MRASAMCLADIRTPVVNEDNGRSIDFAPVRFARAPALANAPMGLGARSQSAPLAQTTSSASQRFEEAGHAHAAADAHRDDAEPLALALELAEQLAGHAGAGHAVRMTNRD